MRLKQLLRNSCRTRAVSVAVGDARGATEENSQVNSGSKQEDFQVIGVGCDVSSELSVQKAFETVMDKFGRVDSVVASAGKCWMIRAPWDAVI